MYQTQRTTLNFLQEDYLMIWVEAFLKDRKARNLAKNLSERPCGTKSNQGTSKVQEGNIGFRLLIPTDQNATKTVHPTMRSFHHPASSAFSSFFLDRFRFFTPTSDVRRKSKFFQNVSHFVIIVAFVQTHILLFLAGRFRLFYHNVFKRVSHHFHVMTISACHGQSNRHAMPLRQYAPFDTAFCSIGWVGPTFFFHPMALSPWHHPCSAIPNQALATRQTVPGQLAIISQTHLPPPTPKIDHGQSNVDKYLFYPAHPIDSLSATQRILHSHRFALEFWDALHQNGVC